MTCGVCAHKRLPEIDEAVGRGDSLSGVARRFGLSRYALRRHRDSGHMPTAALVSVDRTTLIAGRLDDLDARLVRLEGDLTDALEIARQKGSVASLVQAAEAIRRTIETIAKLRHELSDAPVVNVLALPGFQAATSTLLKALEPWPEARWAAAKALETAPS